MPPIGIALPLLALLCMARCRLVTSTPVLFWDEEHYCDDYKTDYKRDACKQIDDCERDYLLRLASFNSEVYQSDLALGTQQESTFKLKRDRFECIDSVSQRMNRRRRTSKKSGHVGHTKVAQR